MCVCMFVTLQHWSDYPIICAALLLAMSMFHMIMSCGTTHLTNDRNCLLVVTGTSILSYPPLVQPSAYSPLPCLGHQILCGCSRLCSVRAWSFLHWLSLHWKERYKAFRANEACSVGCVPWPLQKGILVYPTRIRWQVPTCSILTADTTESVTFWLSYTFG